MSAIKNRRPDWEAIEPHWRAGILSKLEMSQQFSVSRAAMDKHFAKLGIERDLSEQIQQRAESIVTRKQVTQQVTPSEGVAPRVTEQQIIEANAQTVADIRLAHRGDIRRGRLLVGKLMTALESQIDNPELFEELGDLLEQPDDKGQDKLNELYRKVIALPGQVDSVKKLSETLKNLVGLEREAFGMKVGDEGKGGSTIRDLLDAIEGSQFKPKGV